MKSRLCRLSLKLSTGIVAFLVIAAGFFSSPSAAVSIRGSWVEGTTHVREAGTNRALVVMVYAEHSADFSAIAVNYGGRPMNKITEKMFGSGNRSYTAAFILDEAGIAAAVNGTITPSWSTTPSSGRSIISIFLTDVNQSTLTGLASVNGASGIATIAASALSTMSGDMAFVAGTSENQGNYSVNNGFIEGLELGSGVTWGDGVAGFLTASGSNVTPSITMSSSMRQTLIGFVVRSATINSAPNVTITTPGSGAIFTAPATISIAASANDSDGVVTRVNFYQGTTLLGSDSIAPYSYTWSNVAQGNYTLTARAFDNLNANTTSSIIPVSVVLTSYALTVGNDGQGTTNPSGTVTVAPGALTAISAIPAPGNLFHKWRIVNGTATIADTSSDSTTVRLSSGNATIHALFQPVSYTLEVSNDGNGTTMPSGSITVHNQDTISIWASPLTGYQFSHWSLVSGDAFIADASSSSTTVSTINANSIIQAYFTQVDYQLATSAVNGAIILDPPGGFYAAGTVVTVTAVPDDDYTFTEWSGDIYGIDNPATITMDNNYFVEGRFTGMMSNRKKISVAGQLLDNSDNPVGYPNPVLLDMSVRIMDAPDWGNTLYTEQFNSASNQAVLIDKGHFVLRLGEGTTTDNLASVIATHQNLWTEVTVEGPTPDVLLPRTPLSAAPYSIAPASSILHGNGDPNTGAVQALIGTYYVDDSTKETWLRLATRWKQID